MVMLNKFMRWNEIKLREVCWRGRQQRQKNGNSMFENRLFCRKYLLNLRQNNELIGQRSIEIQVFEKIKRKPTKAKIRVNPYHPFDP